MALQIAADPSVGGSYRTDLTLREAVIAASPLAFPLLWRSLQLAYPADQLDVRFDGHVNHMQIVRTGYLVAEGSYSAGYIATDVTDHTKRLYEHLRAIETTLWFGIPEKKKTSHGLELRTCGGVLYYLGREPTDADILVLRPLHGRELHYRRFDDAGRQHHDWISEFTLEVYAV